MKAQDGDLQKLCNAILHRRHFNSKVSTGIKNMHNRQSLGICPEGIWTTKAKRTVTKYNWYGKLWIFGFSISLHGIDILMSDDMNFYHVFLKKIPSIQILRLCCFLSSSFYPLVLQSPIYSSWAIWSSFSLLLSACLNHHKLCQFHCSPFTFVHPCPLLTLSLLFFAIRSSLLAFGTPPWGSTPYLPFLCVPIR